MSEQVEEAVPAGPRANLADSRTLKGAALAAASTMGDQSIDWLINIVQQVAQTSQPLDGASPMFHWLFISSTMLGIAMTAYARWDDHRRGLR